MDYFKLLCLIFCIWDLLILIGLFFMIKKVGDLDKTVKSFKESVLETLNKKEELKN